MKLASRHRSGLSALVLSLAAIAPGVASAADAAQGVEQALQAALQDKRGITLHVNGQAIAGAVTRIEPGAWVELRNQVSGKILVRLDRIDAIAAP